MCKLSTRSSVWRVTSKNDGGGVPLSWIKLYRKSLTMLRKPLWEKPVGKSILHADNKYYSEIYSEEIKLLKFPQNPVQYRMVFRLGLESSKFLFFSGDWNWFSTASNGLLLGLLLAGCFVVLRSEGWLVTWLLSVVSQNSFS